MKKKFEEKWFVTIEQAIKLKELDFEEECLGGWDKDNNWFYHPDSDIVIDAPLKHQIFTWFREKRELSSCIELTDNSRNYYYDFTILDSKNREYNDEDCFDQAGRIYTRLKFDTYEEAESACIDKLFSLVK